MQLQARTCGNLWYDWSCSFDDDLYSLYGALASGRDTLLVSNDQLGDKRASLAEPSLSLLLDQWRKGHQVAISNQGNVNVSMTMRGVGSWGITCACPLPMQLPPQYKMVVHWNKEGHWHIPYLDSTGTHKFLCIKF